MCNKKCKMVVGLAVLPFSLGACGPESEESVEIGSIEQAVQLDYVGAWNVILGEDTLDLGMRATGSIQPQDPPDIPNFSCGVTFVSPHYAVTAAHCVDVYTASSTFSVKQYDTSALAYEDVVSQSVITGSWGSWERSATLGSSVGYEVKEYSSCQLVRNCSTSHGIGLYNCPLSGSVDIAMVRCNDRHDMAYFAQTVDVTENGEEVDVYWYHEVLDLPLYDDETEYWDHYGKKTTTYTDNWHYSSDGGYPSSEHQLLPIHSDSFPDSTPYEAGARSGDIFATDVPVCHGTSGSGTFIGQRLAGVMITAGGDSSLGTQLCDEMNAGAPGEDRSQAVHSSLTSQFCSVSDVREDRALLAFAGALL